MGILSSLGLLHKIGDSLHRESKEASWNFWIFIIVRIKCDRFKLQMGPEKVALDVKIGEGLGKGTC
jgi:hypothetical protein